jgi:hypothetical protein
MRRREFLQNSLRGAGTMAALSIPLPVLAAIPATVSGATLARCVGEGPAAQWAALTACAAVCSGSERVRIDIDALAFPDDFDTVAIDAMFVTDDGLRPFRVANFSRDAVSPLSKPFGFETGRAGLAGLRIERRLRDRETSVAASGLIGGIHTEIAPGRYVLAVASGDTDVSFAEVAVPAQRSDAVVLRDGSVPAFGYLTFTVRAVEVG